MASMESDSNIDASEFCNHHGWKNAKWIATTYKWHPKSEAPPVIGLVFVDSNEGLKVFRSWTDKCGNSDIYDDIRIAIIEDDTSEDTNAYAVHISTNSGDDESHGQWQHIYPLPDNPNMLQDFKREYLKHGEFLLTPVVKREDGQLIFNAHEGIIKREVIFRMASEIKEGDPDAIALTEPPSLGLAE